MSHENFSRLPVAERGSDRTFGLAMAAVATIVGLLPLRHGEQPRDWALLAALALVGLALLAPKALRPLNRLWFQLGMALHRITNPIVMAVLFFGVLTPVSIVFRLSKKDPLGLAFDKEARSYWVERSEGASSDMRKQF